MMYDNTKEIIELNEFDFINASPYEADEVYKYANYDRDNYGYSLINHFLTYPLSAQKVILSWNSPKEIRVADALIEISLKEDMSDSRKIITNRYHGSVYNLLTDTQYFWRVTLRTVENQSIVSKISKFKTLCGRRVLKIEGVENARDIGGVQSISGIPIKQGLVFRCGEMDSEHQITEKGIKEVREVLKVKTDLDLRKPLEINKEGIVPSYSPLGEDINYLHFSAHEYSAFLKGETNEKEILSLFADYANYPILYHCKYGADRTGTVALLLEALCGLDENIIALDYELTQWRQRCYEKYRELVENFKAFKGDTFQQKAYYFMKEILKMTEMQICNIYNILMTDSAIFEADSLKETGKTEFLLNLRTSKSVKEVLTDGRPADFELAGNKLKLSASNKPFLKGEIIFDDGASLRFN